MAQWDGGQQVDANGRQYQIVIANQAAKIISPLTGLGAIGDTLDGIWIYPATTTPGNVIVLDLATVVWQLTGALTLGSIIPVYIPLNWRSVNGAWKITTGANVSCAAWGQFT